MIYILSEDDSLLYLDCHSWDAYDVEERTVEDLIQREVTEPVAVVLSDRSAVAFYVVSPGVVL
jgi:hypothetical protein